VTGDSKGFGFATFSTLEDAIEFMNQTKGVFQASGRSLRVEYKRNTSWTCEACGFLNWRKREMGCKKCEQDPGRLFIIIIYIIY
jgi:hypothetical protein